MPLLLKILKSKELIGAIVVIAALAFWSYSLVDYGGNQATQKIIEQNIKNEAATRETVRRANESIRSSDDFIVEWLRDNNRFRD